MKFSKYSLIVLAAFGLFAVSCEKETDIVESEVTYLPLLEMAGPSSVQLDCNASTFDDPGVDATEGGQDVAVETNVVGRYFGGSTVDSPDDYLISYVAYNQDEIPGAAQRRVLWPECNGDLVTSIAGLYQATVVRDGVVDPAYQDLTYIIIKDLGGNKYQLSDAIGGYYDKGRGYGYHYAALGMEITANDIPSNDFSHDMVIGVGDFGGDLMMNSFEVDAATKTITFSTYWSFDYTFEVTLTQVAQ